ncbi:MAG: 50S ribosomal protein L15 [Gemmatimonadetes bacterium]|nr:50S ribosomal protein L15 [Gemmatimonadota bacterium]
MAELHDLPRPEGSHRNRKRLGRGPGSGTGKTSGRGQKGAGARTGTTRKRGFEGGQMPLQRRIPKRGFTNIHRIEYQLVNVGALERVEGNEVNAETLRDHGLVRSTRKPVKLLGEGEIDRAVNVTVDRISESARSKIEAAGGSVTLIGSAAE